MNALAQSLQERNPYVLTTIGDGTPVFMNKNNPIYEPKQNDRIVSVDCVMANESRLVEITEEFGLHPQDGVFELKG
tara:strand:+ start:1317 stop:1544 length:228 start_codon:yes stop_codon:yes gene_type:complete